MPDTLMSPTALANSLTPQYFELLVRAYVQRQMNKMSPKNNGIFLFVHTDYGTTEIKKCQWVLGSSSETQTKGEILADCVAEHNRRMNFNSTLMLIEGTAEPNTLDTNDSSV